MSPLRQRAIVAICIIVALLATIGPMFTENMVNPLVWLIGICLLFLISIGLLDPWVTRSRETTLSSDQQLAAAADGLRLAIAAQLKAEQNIRELDGPALLPLRWAQTALPVMEQQPDDRRSLNGSLDGLVPWFRSLARQRLVVLGPVGSGKSSLALLLALGLLENPQPDDLIPVLLPVASWNTKENLRGWIARRLREDYPALRNTELYGGYVADLLVEHRKVLPIFDSFDEIPPNLRKAAVEAINHALPLGASFVLMSRPEAYSAAVQEGGPLRGTTVVDLLPVSTNEVADVLRGSSGAMAAARWEPVLVHMRYDPEGPIAKALTSPLLLWLARTRYADLNTNPTELLDSLQFSDYRSIENHLLDGLLDTLFPMTAVDYLPTTSDRWEPTFARHWLAFLADRVHNRELSWWELRHLVHRYWLTILGALSLGLLTMVSVGMMVALSTRLGGIGVALIAGASAGCVVTLGALITTSSRFHGSGFSFRVGIARSLLLVSIVTGTAVGLVFGALFDPISGILAGLSVAVTTTLRFCLGTPGELSKIPNPQLTMARDRALVGLMCLVFGVGVGAITALIFGGGHTGLVWLGFFSGALLGFVLSVLSRSWWWFSIAKTWLAMRGLVPWRLMEFLDDAHQLGILRQVGTRYQFRHAVVQDWIAQTPDRHR